MRFVRQAPAIFALAVICAAAGGAAAVDSPSKYGPAYRQDRDGWIFLHIEGDPRERGYQHGYLLAPEIDDFITTLKVYLKKVTGKEWDWYRNAALTVLADKVEDEYRREMIGIAEGVRDRGVYYDALDILAQNAFAELADYYLPSIEGEPIGLGWIGGLSPPLKCSAFIATGDWTKDGNIVMGHNSWNDYIIGQRFNLILDIDPSNGNRLIMQSAPGYIHSGTDFYVNSAGIVITETTIANFHGYDPNGIPECVRIRKAAQYSNNMLDVVRTMYNGNNGGYANTWLIGNANTGMIGRLELGLKNVSFAVSATGYFDGENYIDNSKMIREECSPTLWFTSTSWPFLLANANCVTARRMRWDALMAEHKGEIDAGLAMQFEADQYEQALGKVNPGGYVLMARMEATDIPEVPGETIAPRPFGANEAKVVTADLARDMSFLARMGHPDGSSYEWGPFLEEHPEFSWQAPYLRDLESHEWQLFTSAGGEAAARARGPR